MAHGTNSKLALAVNSMLRALIADLRTRNRPLARDLACSLKDLRALSESPGASFAATHSGTRGADSAPPPAIDSLYDKHAKQFVLAHTDQALEARIQEARHETAVYRGTTNPRAEQAALNDAFGEDGAAMEFAAMERVVRDYEGTPAERVAQQEGDHRLVEWVKKARRRHRRDPEDGRAVSGWHGWDEATRITEIRKRRSRGWNKVTVSGDIGVSERTLSNYWAHAAPRRAA